ncbi:UNVERIFIED_CONTAM: hypothetical protein RMT77_011520 [Armadillidium vulgare]
MEKNNKVYHLRYFPLRARGEPIRWMLKVCGQEFTDERFEMTKWPSMKKEFEFEKCPVLIVKGQQLHQTTVICRYLAKCHGLAPSDPWQSVKLEEVVESVHDITEYLSLAFQANKLYNNEERMKYFVNKSKMRTYEVAEIIESTIKNEQGWIRSEKMTWADVVIAAYYDLLEVYFPEILSTVPKLQNVVRKVKEIDSIKMWISNRPPLSSFEII